jgi:chaperonin GroEL (HSP60 family)
MSDEAVKSRICPAMGVCHLETGVQAIIPMQIEPERIVEALEAVLNAVKNNMAEGIGCYQIACMMSNEVGAMLAVSTETDDGIPEALDALQAAAKTFAEGAGNAKAKWEMQNKDVTQAH